MAARTTAGPEGVDRETPVPQRLLAVATRLFAERGYDRTSVQEIVEAAGVTKGALYHYFGSKDDLLHEVYARMLRLQQQRLDAVAGSDAPVEERLRAAAADVVVTTIENLDDAMIFFRSMHQLSPEKYKQVRAERLRYHERFRPWSRRGRRPGSSPRPPPPTWWWTSTSVPSTTCRPGTAPTGRSPPTRSPTTSPTCCSARSVPKPCPRPARGSRCSPRPRARASGTPGGAR